MSIENSIKGFITDAKKNNSECKFALGAVTTSFEFEECYFSFPREIKNWGYYFHVVCPSSESANRLLNNLGNLIDEFFLDMETKKLEFCPIEIKNKNSEINFRYLYPNDLTIQACIDLINYNKPQSVFIFGHGGLAFRLVQILDERKIDVKWCPSRKSMSKNYKKLKSSFSKLETSSIDKNVSLFLNLSAYYSNFHQNLLKIPNIKIIDVAGKASIANTGEMKIELVDISARLVNEISFLVNGNKYKENFGFREDIEGNVFVSGGYKASYGDFIVDNFKDPSYIIGISDGMGGFHKRVNQTFSKKFLS
tara:strand:+ start:2236 stop:3159 length:924 start_codon:yes stop_codon:yes gene_type:complete